MTYEPSREWVTYNIDATADNLEECAEDESRPYLNRFPSNPKILLLEPLYPPEAAWGSVKVEQGYVPPLGTISIYRWLEENGYDIDFVDTQFGDYDQETIKNLLRENQYNLIGLPVFTPIANYVFETVKLIKKEKGGCPVFS